jgi:hypothetical protein
MRRTAHPEIDNLEATGAHHPVAEPIRAVFDVERPPRAGFAGTSGEPVVSEPPRRRKRANTPPASRSMTAAALAKPHLWEKPG